MKKLFTALFLLCFSESYSQQATGTVLVTHNNITQTTSGSPSNLAIVRSYNGTPTPANRLALGAWFNDNGTWYPLGAQGATGATGSKGATGSTGATGAQGITGATGGDISFWDTISGVLTNTVIIPITLSSSSVAGRLELGASGVKVSNSYTLPTVDGTAGQVMATDGAGVADWTSIAGATGATGNTGATGAQGVTGDTGATGATGADGSLNAWSLTGSTGISSATNFIGTTNNASFRVKTNNTYRMVVDSTGNVGIGTATPSYVLDVTGNGRFTTNLYVGNRTNSYVGYSSLLIGNASTHSNIEFWDNGTRIAGAYTSSVALNFFSDAGKVINFASNVAFGGTTATNMISLDGALARTIWMERGPAGVSVGKDLTLQSGGARAGNTNLIGGDLLLKSGISTGSGSASIRLYTTTAGSSGTADNNPTEKVTILGSGNVGIGQTTPTSTLHVNGSLATVISLKTANYTLTASDHTVIFDGTTLTATLPAASTCSGREYVLVNRNATALTTSIAFETLTTGVTSTTVTAASSVWIQSDGTNYYQTK